MHWVKLEKMTVNLDNVAYVHDDGEEVIVNFIVPTTTSGAPGRGAFGQIVLLDRDAQDFRATLSNIAQSG